MTTEKTDGFHLNHHNRVHVIYTARLEVRSDLNLIYGFYSV